MVTIRRAEPEDARDLHELYKGHLTKEVQDVSKFTALLTRITANPDYHLLVCDAKGKVVSSVTLVIIPNLTHNSRPYSVIENVVTHTDFRNLGHASALIDKACEIAKENNCYKITITTGSKKESTLRFYEKCGFNMNEKTAFLKRL